MLFDDAKYRMKLSRAMADIRVQINAVFQRDLWPIRGEAREGRRPPLAPQVRSIKSKIDVFFPPSANIKMSSCATEHVYCGG